MAEKMLAFKQRLLLAMIAGLLTISASDTAWGTPAGPTLTLTLGKDQIDEAVSISLGLSKQLAGEIQVDYLYSSAEIILPRILVPQKYTLQGHARMKPGRRVKVEGHGILITRSYFEEAFQQTSEVGGFLAVWQNIVRGVNRADPDVLPINRVSWQMPGAVDDKELEEAENRLEMKLPAIYQEAMRLSGPWKLSFPNGFTFELLAPSQLISVSEWLQKYYGPSEWEDQDTQAMRQSFKQDIVFAIVDNEPWVLRRSGKPCRDEQASFTVGQTADEVFYSSTINVCDTNRQIEAMRRQMLEALITRALSAPEFTVVDENQRLHLERKEPSEKNVLQLFLKAGV